MGIKKKIKKLAKPLLIIGVLFIIVSITVFIYESYFHEYSGRNEKEVQTASIIEMIASSMLDREKGNFANANEDMILSNNSKFRYNDNVGEEFYTRLEKISKETNDLDYSNGQYYIEIRNHKVYKVIYASWLYSGYVGIYPQYSDQAKAYKSVASEAKREFEDYLSNKK